MHDFEKAAQRRREFRTNKQKSFKSFLRQFVDVGHHWERMLHAESLFNQEMFDENIFLETRRVENGRPWTMNKKDEVNVRWGYD